MKYSVFAIRLSAILVGVTGLRAADYDVVVYGGTSGAVMAAVQARLSGLDPALEEAALDLGATPAQAFTKVLVPYLMPAIVSGALMSFTLSLDELIVTYFTASAATRTLPLEIFGRVKKGLDPSLNAISTVFILVTVLAVFLTEGLRRRNA